MTTTLRNLGLVLAAMIPMSLAGCTLYFDDGDSDGRGWDDGGDYSDDGGGYYCSTDRQCAAGCYCDDSTGTCEEAGFCDDDSDCGAGYVCDETRDSCEPGSTCTTNADCDAGAYCDNGTCTTSCVCTTDAEAQAGGFGYCDEDRGTCLPTPDAGSCAGEITPGGLGFPSCGVGQVPLIKDGAYTGQCQDIATCDVVPVCNAFQHEEDCLSTTDTDNCSAAYTGIGCHTPDNTSTCTTPGANCVCDRYEYASCRDISPNGNRVLAGSGVSLQSVMSF